MVLHLPFFVTRKDFLFCSSSVNVDKMHKALTTSAKPANGGDDDVWETDADFEVSIKHLHTKVVP